MPRTGPIRILFTIPNFITAGSGQLLLDIAERLNPDRFEPHICVLRTGGKLENRIQQLGIPLHEIAFTTAPRPLTDLPLRVIRQAKAFRPYRFDLWHSFHYADDYTEPLIARAAGAKVWIQQEEYGLGQSCLETAQCVLHTDCCAEHGYAIPVLQQPSVPIQDQVYPTRH